MLRDKVEFFRGKSWNFPQRLLRVVEKCVILWCMEKGSHSKLPTRYIAVGEVLRRYGKELLCEVRPGSLLLPPSCACEGCWFKNSREGNNVINCNDIQCSCWDRADGKDVWFRALGKSRGRYAHKKGED